MENNKINFNKYFKLFNIFSISLVLLSIVLLLFKGLNYGVDFKGGTLIEIILNILKYLLKFILFFSII